MSTPVALVASSRKGTQMTTSALSQHPLIYCHKEQWFSHSLDKPLTAQQLYPDIAGIDFVVHSASPYARNTYRESMEYYDSLPKNTVYVILNRNNMVRWYVSLKIAQQTKRWGCMHPNEQQDSVKISTIAMLDRIAVDGQQYASVCAKLLSMDAKIVSALYEDWEDDPLKASMQLQQDIGVTPVLPLLPTAIKQHPQPLRDLVSNYDEMAETIKSRYPEFVWCLDANS